MNPAEFATLAESEQQLWRFRGMKRKADWRVMHGQSGAGFRKLFLVEPP
jgi:hypothetical protein